MLQIDLVNEHGIDAKARSAQVTHMGQSQRGRAATGTQAVGTSERNTAIGGENKIGNRDRVANEERDRADRGYETWCGHDKETTHVQVDAKVVILIGYARGSRR